MYTSEFIEKVEALPFVGKVRKHPTVENVGVYNDDGVGILLVSESEYLIVDTDRTAFESLRVNQKDELMHLVWQYISTPVDEREPEKRFRLKAKKELNIGEAFGNKYLNYDRRINEISFSDGSHDCVFSTIFTDSKIEELFTDEQLKWIEMTFDKEWRE